MVIRDDTRSPRLMDWFGDPKPLYSAWPQDTIPLLQSLLENGKELPEDVVGALGLSFDYSKMKKWTSRYIKWQVAAQMCWFENPGMSLEEIKEMVSSTSVWHSFLELVPSREKNDVEGRKRGLEDTIRDSLRGKSGRPRDDMPRPAKVIPIWSLHAPEGKINGKVLHAVISSISAL